MVKCGLGVGSGTTLRVGEFLAAGMVVSVSVVKCTLDIVLVVDCVVPVLSLECCGVGLEVV